MKEFSKELPLIPLPFQVIEFEDGVVLKRGLSNLVVSGPASLERVLYILTLISEQASTCDQITSRFPSKDQLEIETLIENLYRKEFIVSSDQIHKVQAKPLDIFYDQFGVNKQIVSSSLSKLHIVLCGINSLTSSLFNSFRAQGVRNITFYDDRLLRNFNYINLKNDYGNAMTNDIADKIIDDQSFRQRIKDDKVTLLVAASDFGGQSLLLKWNAFSIKNRIHFYPIYIEGLTGYAGPIVIPGDTPCLDCLRHRQNSHLKDLRIRELLEQNATNAQTIIPSHPAITGVVSNIAFFEIVRFYGGLKPQTHPAGLMKIDLIASRTESKRVLKIPRCPSCSNLRDISEVQVKKMNPMQKR